MDESSGKADELRGQTDASTLVRQLLWEMVMAQTQNEVLETIVLEVEIIASDVLSQRMDGSSQIVHSI